MINILKESLWTQFGASIDMLKNAIELWPEEYWYTEKRFFYVAYHVLVFLDYYLTISPTRFSSQLPFTIVDQEQIPEDAVDDLMPNRVYSKKEILDYLQFCREKCRKVISELGEVNISDRWIEESGDMNYSIPEILLYNMRHVQHHTAQLNLMLRNRIDNAPEWVARAGE